MSARKRSDQSADRPPKRPVHESGVMYLYQQLRELDTDKSPFIVEADESDVTSWTIGISSGSMREHLDLSPLARELDQWQRASQQQPVMVMSVRFPVDYPKSVPFVRMIKPRFKWHTGHVTIGGSMCTQLLTPGGWQPMTVHALLLTVCQMLREGEARIQLKPDEHCMWPLKDYSEMEAREAYERVAKFHGWPTQRRHA